MVRPSRTAVQITLLFLIVVPLALLARWHLGDRGWGPNFLPHPDSVEYAAGAQSLARFDGYFLQIGPHRFPPRYPPGWSLILSVAVRAGVAGQSLWRVTGIFGSLLAFLVALSTYAAAQNLHPRLLTVPGGADSWIGFGAGLTGGLVWAFAPLPVFLGQSGLSDEPCLCLSVACILLVLAGTRTQSLARRGHDPRPVISGTAVPLWVAAGLMLGMVAAMRFISAGLLAVPLAVFCAAGSARSRWRVAAWGLIWVACGTVCALVSVSYLTGRMPWQWSGYAFWIPRWYAHLSDTFNLAYALSGNPTYFEPMGVKAVSHVVFGLQVMLGLPGRWEIAYIGKWWPVLGWAALGFYFFKARRIRGPANPAVWVIAGLGVWVAGHLALFSIYFYPAPRFYLAPLTVCLVAFGAGCALVASSGRLGKSAAGLMAVAVVAGTLVMGQKIPFPPAPRSAPQEVAERFSHWLAAGDPGRGGQTVPFDLVQAQALGLYTPQSLSRVNVWGTLPRQPHVVRMLAGGRVGRDEVAAK